jgi:hypothetical protein
VSSAARRLLAPARRELQAGLRARTDRERYMHAHRAAVRAVEALVRLRQVPDAPVTGLWSRLLRVALELETWADLFGSTRARAMLAAVVTGRRHVTPVEAADQLRYAEALHAEVEKQLGLPYEQVLPGELPPTGGRP